ncbi:membrane protein insertase MisCB [Paenibacillus curdlanolyticus]|nr:membrane protein insertase YidC [Paenibacillus curdlanolyticus]GFN32019.1 membrane protein insertase MisCB [Paenibacillus curdlanolyticus]
MKITNKRFPIPRRYILILSFLVLVLISGCSASGTIDSNTPGLFNHYVVYPFSELIQHIASSFSGSYGISIMLLTLIVRLVLMPLMIRQQLGVLKQRAKLKKLEPELAQLNKKYKESKEPDALRQKQQEMLQLYQQHGVNPFTIGCLPLLIQLPILTGLYFAIQMTPELTMHSFLWFELGSKDLIMPFVVAGVYWGQTVISQRLLPTASSGPQQPLAALVYLSPIAMGLFSFTVPAALPLYWTTGALFMIGQSALTYRLFRRQSIEEDLLTISADKS